MEMLMLSGIRVNWDFTKMQIFGAEEKIKIAPLALAVETSGRSGSVALGVGGKLLSERRFPAPMKHSAEVLTAMGALLRRFGKTPKQVDQVYISAGPGSFTGLRIAVTIAKMMNLAGRAQIAALDTLDVIAANAADYVAEKQPNINKIATILDAKRSQFFTAVYRKKTGKWEKIQPDYLMTAPEFVEKFADPDDPVWLLGEGLVYYKNEFTCAGIEFFPESTWVPRAGKVYQLGWEKACAGDFADPLELTPAYLRKPDVKTPCR